MTLTLIDFFCGAGGSSQGAAAVPGVTVALAADHWDRAIESHAANFPATDHFKGGRPGGGRVSREGRMIGRTYLEKGRPVVVLTRWGKGGGPRNVLIRRENGTLVVRPFRGLRKPRSPEEAS